MTTTYHIITDQVKKLWVRLVFPFFDDENFVGIRPNAQVEIWLNGCKRIFLAFSCGSSQKLFLKTLILTDLPALKQLEIANKQWGKDPDNYTTRASRRPKITTEILLQNSHFWQLNELDK